jgi:hypothetical protein
MKKSGYFQVSGIFRVVVMTRGAPRAMKMLMNYPARAHADRTRLTWLAKLMRYGLLQASVIPPVEQRDLRDLARYRTTRV